MQQSICKVWSKASVLQAGHVTVPAARSHVSHQMWICQHATQHSDPASMSLHTPGKSCAKLPRNMESPEIWVRRLPGLRQLPYLPCMCLAEETRSLSQDYRSLPFPLLRKTWQQSDLLSDLHLSASLSLLRMQIVWVGQAGSQEPSQVTACFSLRTNTGNSTL